MVHTNLIRAVAAGKGKEECGKAHRFLTVCERLVCHKYPASAKRFLHLNYNLSIGVMIPFLCVCCCTTG